MFSCYIWNIQYVRELVVEYQKLCPNTPIWLGGPEVSYESAKFLQENPAVKGIIIAEGEKIFTNLCSLYANWKGDSYMDLPDEELAKIKGLIFRKRNAGENGAKEDALVQTPPQMPMNLSEVPFPYDQLEDFENRIIYYESSRGCPFSCSYCLSSIDKKLRFRDIELVKKELQFFIDHKVPQVKFVDRTFNCKHDHAMAIWTYIKEHDNGITNFHFEISADLLKEEEIAYLQTFRPGLVQLEIGVQSTNPKTIEEIHRTMNLEELKRIVRKIQKNGNIHQHLDLIAGLPYEDYERFGQSFDEIYELKPEQLQLGFLKVLKGSYMKEHEKEYGLIAHSIPPYEVLATKWLSYDEVQKLRRVEDMTEVYYNSWQYEVTMKMMEPVFKSPFAFYQALGDFYEEKGYFKMKHSRIRRSEILLEFLTALWDEQEKWKTKELLCENQEFCEASWQEKLLLWKEAMTFDLYYRENAKTRPSFASDLSAWKQLTREYCKNGKLSHLEAFHYEFPGFLCKNVKELPKRMEKERYVLFDYAKRDALNHQAEIHWLPEGVQYEEKR